MGMEIFSRIYSRSRGSKFRGSFNGICVVVLLLFFIYKEDTLQNPFSDTPSLNFPPKTGYEKAGNLGSNRNPTICSRIPQHEGFDSPCEYLRANPECNSGGFLNYLVFFYCDCRKLKALGYVVLAIWLLSLFYLLGNTAADYFCCCLEKLSCLLKLPPTVAGVTLLPLGNGAPDVSASIAAFVGRDSGDVGLNSVLGGAVFVTCVVAGAVSLCVADRNVRIDKKCFVRDVSFFLIALVSLLMILVVGKVSVWGAVAFVFIYVVYAAFVAVKEVLRKRGSRLKLGWGTRLLPVVGGDVSGGSCEDVFECTSLLELSSEDGVPHLQAKLPPWMWASNMAIYSNEVQGKTGEGEGQLWGWSEEDTGGGDSWCSSSALWSILEVPLALPRRLTIPIVDEDRWSKMYAVASAFFAPVLLAVLWCAQDGVEQRSRWIICLVSVMVGSIVGLLALKYTTTDHPPRKCLLPWVLGGFVMSIVWFYIIANELVALLAALGSILGIKPSLLGLTILAWGNSMGDLMSNLAIAMNSSHGIQIAMSGCYAGPMFNTLIGLGASLCLGAWGRRPALYVIPRDSSLYSTLGFLVVSLVWALVILPCNDMRPGRVLGVGLMTIYMGFLALRVGIAMGDGSIDI